MTTEEITDARKRAEAKGHILMTYLGHCPDCDVILLSRELEKYMSVSLSTLDLTHASAVVVKGPYPQVFEAAKRLERLPVSLDHSVPVLIIDESVKLETHEVP